MIDRNLFLYDLAVTAIFKNEAPYLKEWLDYHLLAGVDHFYLYNNDSTDNYAEVLAPYVEKNLVTLIDFPGKAMQYSAFEDAIDKYRFECRYMAFIDLDEFIYPKVDEGTITDLVDQFFFTEEIFFHTPKAAGVSINWQCFGSSGETKADYSRGVLERFTHRAQSDWDLDGKSGNVFKKTIDNPRLIRYRISPYFSCYFEGKSAVLSNDAYIGTWYGNKPILSDQIVINHYFTKSKEEFWLKQRKGRADGNAKNLSEEDFQSYDRNEVFDDGILTYRAARAKNFSLESNDERINRAGNALVQTLMKTSTKDSLTGKLETFLTCRALAEKFQIKIGDRFAEEYALAWIYRALLIANPLTVAEIQQFLKALPEILTRPFPVCKELKTLAQDNVIPRFCEAMKAGNVNTVPEDWKMCVDMLHLQKLLRLIK
ncbi:MAG: glycosyltransferase family 92 protein [Selenomonadaceae bacterium]|nr:glycosyltransferase family 92 protein [Selenomonadaceae bacterium]MBR4643522.1 glycosyltransferase family 92 protein [Selenomonadaceae bacterium]